MIMWSSKVSLFLSFLFLLNHLSASSSGVMIFRGNDELKCVEGSCDLYSRYVVSVMCEQVSFESDIWRCEAELPDTLRFGKTDVICVSADRCRLEYELLGKTIVSYTDMTRDERFAYTILSILFVCGMICLVYCCDCMTDLIIPLILLCHQKRAATTKIRVATAYARKR